MQSCRHQLASMWCIVTATVRTWIRNDRRRDVAVPTVRPGLRQATRYLHDSEMVEPRGIEPLTSCMPCKRSPG